MHHNLVGLPTLAMLVAGLGLVLPGLPANGPIHRDAGKIVRWKSEDLDEGRVIVQKDYLCSIAPVLQGPHLKSESS